MFLSAPSRPSRAMATVAAAVVCAAAWLAGPACAAEPAAPGPVASTAKHPVSSRFVVMGDVKAQVGFDLAALRALPPVTRQVGTHVYTGASLWALLDSAVGIAVDPAVKNDLLAKVVVATGSDGYKAVFSLGELHPAFGNAPDIVAYEVDGAPLGADGFARVVVPGDAKGGRQVANLVRIEVFTPASAASAVPPR